MGDFGEKLKAALANAIDVKMTEFRNLDQDDLADKIAAAVLELVSPKPLVWAKSNIAGWNGDYHTLPTAYTIRCADENGWKWCRAGAGAFGYSYSPEAAQAAAQAHADGAHWANTALGDMINP